MKQVNIGWQMAATLLIPTGLYAFNRIKKLKYGMLLYLCTYFLFGISTIIPLLIFHILPGENSIDDINANIFELSYSLTIIIIGIINIFLPIYFIRKWSMEWNNQIKILS